MDTGKAFKLSGCQAYNRYFEPLPQLKAALFEVPDRYNWMQEDIDRLEQEGRIFVIRPERPVRVSRLERDLKKLQALHQEGRERPLSCFLRFAAIWKSDRDRRIWK